MKIKWSSEAMEDLAQFQAYVSKDNPAAARNMALKIVMAVEISLPTNPAIGRPGRVIGTRELVIAATPYLVPYRLHQNEIQVLRVYHGARRWPERF